MRIGTYYSQLSTTDQLLRNQFDLYTTQSQIASGKKINVPSDDPGSMAQITTSRASLKAEASYEKNQVYLDSMLRTVESTLGAVGNSLSTAREALVQANNATLTDADRNSIAASLRQRRAELLTQANTTGGDGQYLFSGFQSSAPPFADAAGGVVFGGDNGTRNVLVGPSRSIAANADGDAIFMNIPRGNGVFSTAAAATNGGTGRIETGGVNNPAALTGQNYEIRFTGPANYDIVNTSLGTTLSSGVFQSGTAIQFGGMQMVIDGQPAGGDIFAVDSAATQSIFTSLDRAIAALETPVFTSADRARLSDTMRGTTADLDQAISRALEIRGEIGGRMNALDLAGNISANTALDAGTTLSGLEDIDYAEASTRFTRQKTAVDAALAAYAQTTRGTLFDYLR